MWEIFRIGFVSRCTDAFTNAFTLYLQSIAMRSRATAKAITDYTKKSRGFALNIDSIDIKAAASLCAHTAIRPREIIEAPPTSHTPEVHMAKHGLPRVCLLDAALLLNAAERYMRFSGSPLYESIRTMADALEALSATSHRVQRDGHLTWSALSSALRQWMNDSMDAGVTVKDWLVAYHEDFYNAKVALHGRDGFRELYDRKWLRHMAQQLKEEYKGRAGFKPAAKPVKQDRQAIDRTPRPKIEKVRPIMHKFYGQN